MGFLKITVMLATLFTSGHSWALIEGQVLIDQRSSSIDGGAGDAVD